MSRGSGWLKIAAAAASGLLVAGLFPPFDLTLLVWVAMLPLLAALISLEGKRAAWKGFGLGYFGGLVSCLIQFNWLSTVSWVGAVLLPLYLAIFWGLFGAFVATLGRPVDGAGPWRSLRAAFCIGAGWAGLEWLRGWLFTGFSWNGLGVGFHDWPLMAQGADLLGVTGLSFLLVFFQSVLVIAARSVVLRRQGFRWDVAAAAALVAGLAGYGNWRIASSRLAESVRLKTLLVQLNIPQMASRMLWTDLEIHQGYEDETLEGLARLKMPEGEPSADWPDWVMWPEAALTGRILWTDDGEWATWQINHDTISRVRQAGPFELIYGVNELEGERVGENLVPKENPRTYNSIAAMSPADDLRSYKKRHLVIFGETIPFVDSVPWLRKIYEQQAGVQYGGSFTPGDSLEPLPIPVDGVVVGAIPTVCFEDSVSRLTRKFVRPEPQVIINVTNDGWFKNSPAAAQHFANAKFRAIELRRPMLRSANTGISAAVDTTGSLAHPDTGEPQILVDAAGSHFTRGSRLVELDVPLRPATTLYAAIGDLGILGISAAGVVLGLTGRRRSRTDPAG